MITAERYHDISCGHRVVGHENKCRHLHGHNYRIHFSCSAMELDSLGRVIDFGVIKSKLCMWVENNWDHKFLAWGHDRILLDMCSAIEAEGETRKIFKESVVWTPFNPTAENMAFHLLSVVGPLMLKDTGVSLIKVTIEETAKCQATASI